MSEEERQRQMDFILEHQAQFTVDIQQLREAQAQTDRQLADFAQTQTEFIQIVTKHIEAQGEINNSLRTMMGNLNTGQARTDERLNSLAATVERYITEGRNGRPQ